MRVCPTNSDSKNTLCLRIIANWVIKEIVGFIVDALKSIEDRVKNKSNEIRYPAGRTVKR